VVKAKSAKIAKKVKVEKTKRVKKPENGFNEHEPDLETD